MTITHYRCSAPPRFGRSSGRWILYQMKGITKMHVSHVVIVMTVAVALPSPGEIVWTSTPILLVRLQESGREPISRDRQRELTLARIGIQSPSERNSERVQNGTVFSAPPLVKPSAPRCHQAPVLTPRAVTCIAFGDRR